MFANCFASGALQAVARPTQSHDKCGCCKVHTVSTKTKLLVRTAYHLNTCIPNRLLRSPHLFDNIVEPFCNRPEQSPLLWQTSWLRPYRGLAEYNSTRLYLMVLLTPQQLQPLHWLKLAPSADSPCWKAFWRVLLLLASNPACGGWQPALRAYIFTSKFQLHHLPM